MDQCPICDHQRSGDELKCPHCDVFYTKLDELISEEEQKVFNATFKGRMTNILKSENPRAALKLEVSQWFSSLTLYGYFVLFVIFVFVFALMITVI